MTIVRLMGKRALGELSLFDLVIMAGIGDVITLVGLGESPTLPQALLFLGILGGLEILLSLITYKSRRFAHLLEGSPTILIKDGKIIEESLRRENISLADLRQELRKEGVARISEVKEAVLEACGKLSVIPVEEEGNFLEKRLETIENQLRELKSILEDKYR